MLPTPVQLPALICLLSVALLLVFERQGLRRAEWLFKPLAALAFIWAGLACGALDSVYGQWILMGLVLCMAGDVLLIPRGQGPAFLAGMAAFLLGHLGYAIAFLQLPLDMRALLGAVVGMGLAAALVLRWLWAYLDAQFKVAVVAYVLVISAMVCLAVATGHSWVIIGAIAFAVSDLSVARNRFVAPGLFNRQWGLPLYFASQLVIAATIVMV
ncbi:putative membrane protein YhhN [Litorivivens lipolytica]|uniref:Putative membrane protein YhhN n=1 Tax=Litorivivens lipolytica TaxID=1524264 RepID=A0A7W4Z6J4_9GAMM|nr:lysoplasmalogenase [Litorivivens lipolytica]MBB3048333.1 putative membrane protein YhhN [Litorivivens lipolytica]